MAITVVIDIVPHPIRRTGIEAGVVVVAIISAHTNAKGPVSIRVAVDGALIAIVVQTIIIGLFLSRVDPRMGIVAVRALRVAVVV